LGKKCIGKIKKPGVFFYVVVRNKYLVTEGYKKKCDEMEKIRNNGQIIQMGFLLDLPRGYFSFFYI